MSSTLEEASKKPVTDTDLDDFYDLFQGKDSISGTNTRWIQKQVGGLMIKERDTGLSVEEGNQLAKNRYEVGLTSDGKSKPITCWKYVRNKQCQCGKDVSGKVIANRWHPAEEERLYLNLKNKNAR